MSIDPIDYDSILNGAPKSRKKQVINFLMRELPPIWSDHYENLTKRGTNILWFHENGVQFLFDFISEGHGRVTKNVPNDRVVAVYGVSREVDEDRDETYMRNIMGRNAFDRWRRDYNKGHFAALKQGGPYGPNLFPQAADLNLNNRPLPAGQRGREWRRIEIFLQKTPGLFYFVRPLYRGAHTRTWVPAYLEYGVLHWGDRVADCRFEVRTFVN